MHRKYLTGTIKPVLPQLFNLNGSFLKLYVENVTVH